MRGNIGGSEYVSVGDAICADKSGETHQQLFDTMMDKTIKENPNKRMKISANPSDFEVGLTKKCVNSINNHQRIICETEFCSSHFSGCIQKTGEKDGGKTFYKENEEYAQWLKKIRLINCLPPGEMKQKCKEHFQEARRKFNDGRAGKR